MRLSRPALALLALILAGPALLSAQEQPLAAGSDGVPVPKKKKHVQPVYPPEALAQGIRGIVILDLVIDGEGRVVETAIIRSIPGLDEAALIAAQQWIYNPVKVNGEPVSVRLTVPITFALKLPAMTRQDGIPELRQGVTPPWPTGGAGRGQAVADVTLEPDGRIGLARIIEGEEPWSTSLLQALRTWRFRSLPDDVTVSFRVEAQFLPGGPEKGGVELNLSGLRETALFDAPGDEPVALADAAPGPAAAAAAGPPTETPAPETAEEPTSPEGAPVPPAPALPEPTGEAPSTPTADASPPATAGPEPTEPLPAAPPAPPAMAEARRPTPGPAPEPAAHLPETPSAPTLPRPGAPGTASPATGAVDPTAPPPIEVLTASPPPLPPENGVSAIRGVELEPGVPDLTQGRRPVAPPFARMKRASGEVTVEFSVSAGGVTAVQRSAGTEVFRAAATQAVESWIFRRTRADRAYLIAVFKYEDDLASAVVRPQAAP
jgi:TonB family protein